MYKIEFKDLVDAARLMYRFMVNPELTRPECIICKNPNKPISFTNLGKGFMPEEEFCQMILSSNYEFVACVASTDNADKRRAVLALLPYKNYLKLNFPQSYGKPNAAERRLVQTLNNA